MKTAKLLHIKQNLSFKSNFVCATYIWNENKINHNTKGTDFYNLPKRTQTRLITEIIENPEDSQLTKMISSKYEFKKLGSKEKGELKKCGIEYDVDYAWCGEIGLGAKSWKTGNQKITEDITTKFKKVAGFKKNIQSVVETLMEGPRTENYSYSKMIFKNTDKKEIMPLGINIVLLKPIRENNTCPIYITFRKKEKYGDGTNRLIEYCEKLKINYYVEYYEAIQGYQELINYKPKFILNTIIKLENYGVLYIDGDMYIDKYPAIFDQQQIDCMFYNWSMNEELVLTHKSPKQICVNMFITAVSGGIMFFNCTSAALNILNLWIIISANNPGKADDRLLDVVFNITDTIQSARCYWLPIRFLYITDKYNSNSKIFEKLGDYKMVVHPEDITSEEFASGMGASSNRYPVDYYYNKKDPAEKDSYDSHKTSCIMKTKNSVSINIEDENMIFQNVAKGKEEQLFKSLRDRSKLFHSYDNFDVTQYDYKFKIGNKADRFVKEDTLKTTKHAKSIFVIHTKNKNLYEELKNKWKFNKEYGAHYILLKNSCHCSRIASLYYSYSKFNDDNRNLQFIPVLGEEFNQNTDLFKYLLTEWRPGQSKPLIDNLGIIINDRETDFFCMNLNSILNVGYSILNTGLGIKKHCLDNNILNIAPGSFICIQNRRCCRYFIDRCLTSCLQKKITNVEEEAAIMDNIFNRYMLIVYWNVHWLPEEYIYNIIECEDWWCEWSDINQVVKEKNKHVDKEWKTIQKALKRCHKRLQPPISALFKRYQKNLVPLIK
jgi:hypothetical protein